MFDSVELLDSWIHDSLRDSRFYSKQSWVVPAVTGHGEKVHDVVIVGAGQNGLALAYNLKLRGVRRIKVLDAQDEDRPGPWSSFARMPQLRTPKSIPGPDCANPLLRFKTWFCSRYSAAEYDTFEFIPLRYWGEYLAWYRRVLDIDTVNNARVVGMEWDATNGCLRLDAEGRDGARTRFYARKVCLATGMTAAGRWAPPRTLVERLPRRAYFCAWEPIAWAALRGADVGVIGAGASAFDNASHAVDAGCGSVTLFGRSAFPKKDLYFELWRGRDDSYVFADETAHPPADLLDALLAHHWRLTDSERLRLVGILFRNGRSPANPDYLARVRNLDRIRVLEHWPIERVDYDDTRGRVRVHGSGARFDFDAVIFATGPQTELRHRPELSRLCDRLRTWGDEIGEADPTLRDLYRYPKLSRHFQLQSKDGHDGQLSNIYSLADLIHNTVGLQSTQYVATTVADHISFSLYQEQFSKNVSLIEDLAS